MDIDEAKVDRPKSGEDAVPAVEVEAPPHLADDSDYEGVTEATELPPRIIQLRKDNMKTIQQKKIETLDTATFATGSRACCSARKRLS